MQDKQRKRLAGERRPGRDELAFLLPFFGTVLLVPPLVNLFIGKRIVLFGLPLETLYVFTVWLLIIAGTLVLSLCHPFRDSLGSGEDRHEDDHERAGLGPDHGVDADHGGPARID